MFSRLVPPECSGREFVFACIAGGRSQIVEVEMDLYCRKSTKKRELVPKVAEIPLSAISLS
jgi:hypothetical protein